MSIPPAHPPRQRQRPSPRPKTLLAVLPVTTAWGGAAAMILVPGGASVIGFAVTRDVGAVQFLGLTAPWMLICALVTAAFGLAVGALAGLPDWLLRRRPEQRLLGAVAAVVIVTALVGGAWAVLATALGRFVPMPVDRQVVIVTLATATVTSAVVAISRHRDRRGAAR